MRTFQLRLTGDYPALDAMAGLYQTVTRKLYAQAAKDHKSFASYKAEFCRGYGLPARLFNAIEIGLKGMVASVQEKSKLDLDEVTERRWRTEVKLKHALVKRDAAIAKAAGKIAVTKLTRDLTNLRRKIVRCENRMAFFQEQSTASYPKICFGSRQLFNAQHKLVENRLADHAAWKSLWRAKRASQFQVVGSSDEITGNKTCRAEIAADGSISLTLSLAGAAYDQKLTIAGLRLAHGHDNLVRAIQQSNIECRQAVAWQMETKRLVSGATPAVASGASRPDETDNDAIGDTIRKARKRIRANQPKLGFAIAYRFLKDVRGWRIFITITEPVVAVVADFQNGAIGIDHNADHFAIALVGPRGELLATSRRPAIMAGKTSGQRQALIGDIVAALVAEAKALAVPLVIEDLDFTKKRRLLRDLGDARQARMLSSFGYSLFRKALVACAKRHGVAVVTVNPAWTSVLGAACYVVPNGLSVHRAAAYAIARRALKLSETIPSQPRLPSGCDHPIVLTLPARLQSKAPESEGTKSEISDVKVWKWIASASKAERVARLRLRPSGSQRRSWRADEKALDEIYATAA